MKLPYQYFFKSESKHQNKAEFKNLDDAKVLSSDFPDLRTSSASMTSTASTTSMASMTSTASFRQKHYYLRWLDHPDTKMTNTGPFLCNHQKSNFY